MGKRRKKKKKKRKRERERAGGESGGDRDGRSRVGDGSHATRDGMAARKKREGTVGGKDGTTIEIGHQDGGNSGRGLGLTGLNDEKVLKKVFLARDLTW